MTKHQAPRDFTTEPSPACPVAELALRFGAAEKEWHALDGQDLNDVAEALALNEMTMQTLTDSASLGTPTSALGALFQVLIISQQADLLQSLVEGDDSRQQARKDVMRLEGALWGIRRFLETHFGISADKIGAEYLMTESASYAAKLKKAVEAANAPGAIALQAAE